MSTAFGGGRPVRWGFGLGLVGALACAEPGPADTSAPASQGRPTAAASPNATSAEIQPRPSTDRLALVSTRGYEDAGYHHVAGLVANISDVPLQDVTVMVSWYTDWEDFITSRESRIDTDPLPPGQSSPFDILGPPTPLVSKFSVQFREAGGETMLTLHRP